MRNAAIALFAVTACFSIPACNSVESSGLHLPVIQGNLLYSQFGSKFVPCRIKDRATKLTGIPLLRTDRLEKFAQMKHVHLCSSCGYHLECKGRFVRIQERGQNIRVFQIDEVIELREHRPGDCDTEPKQD